MIKGREDLALGAEAHRRDVTLRKIGAHQLDGHQFLVDVVGASREIHLPHAAFGNQAEQLIGANMLARRRALGGGGVTVDHFMPKGEET
jgi:hypothetical protein